ncbi:SDR family oxidoreductase [Carnobacterium funditum]|uniref:SDR family oxidoreductase n=1 Tax=Carnobacterium funditum TaxID=2752 RepID=UPI00054F3231|nr:SDR family oxidoreductase [Carnobacterium funditum]
MTILVTGATGLLGTKVVEALLRKGVPAESIAVAVRDPKKAQDFAVKGVDVRQADYEDIESLERAFTGVDRLLLISSQGDNNTRITHHKNAVFSAKAAGVHFIAYTSCSKPQTSHLPIAEVHRITEKMIHETGIPYSFLRNNWYIENEIDTLKAILDGAPLVTSAGDGQVGWVPRIDYAEAAAAVLSTEDHKNTIYELSGIPSTYEDMAIALSSLLDKEVPLLQVNDQEYRQFLIEQGFPEGYLDFYVEVQQAIRQGDLTIESSDLSSLLNRPAITLQESLTEIIHKFRSSK